MCSVAKKRMDKIMGDRQVHIMRISAELHGHKDMCVLKVTTPL